MIVDFNKTLTENNINKYKCICCGGEAKIRLNHPVAKPPDETYHAYCNTCKVTAYFVDDKIIRWDMFISNITIMAAHIGAYKIIANKYTKLTDNPIDFVIINNYISKLSLLK